jgi:hypothetical protein
MLSHTALIRRISRAWRIIDQSSAKNEVNEIGKAGFGEPGGDAISGRIAAAGVLTRRLEEFRM